MRCVRECSLHVHVKTCEPHAFGSQFCFRTCSYLTCCVEEVALAVHMHGSRPEAT